MDISTLYVPLHGLLDLVHNERAFAAQVLRLAAKAIDEGFTVEILVSKIYKCPIIALYLGESYIVYYYGLSLNHVHNQLVIQEVKSLVRDIIKRRS